MVSVHISQRIRQSDEQVFHLETNDFFRPPLKQLDNSIFRTKKTYADYAERGGVTFVPSHLGPRLRKVKDHIDKLLSQGSEDISAGFDKGFVFIAYSLAIALNLTIKQRPDNVICDAFILLPHQPAMVLTVIEDQKSSTENRKYNASLARGSTTNIRKFTSENMNIVFGILPFPVSVASSRSTIKEIVLKCSKCVPPSSLSMDSFRYDKILVAFWAAVSETTSVLSETESHEENYLRFLTTEQCIALVENINVESALLEIRSGCGATTLMTEVARRLSKVDPTVLVCSSPEEKDRFSSLHLKTVSTDDIKDIDLTDFKHIVTNADDITFKPKGKLWRFMRVEEDRGKELGNAMDIQTSAGSVEVDEPLITLAKLENTAVGVKQLTKKELDDYQLLVCKIGSHEKKANNLLRLIHAIKFEDRQRRIKYLTSEIDTLKLCDMKLSDWVLKNPAVHALDHNSDTKVEGSWNCNMIEELTRGLQQIQILYPILLKAVMEDKNRIAYMEAKQDFLIKVTCQTNLDRRVEMPRMSHGTIWQLAVDGRRNPFDEQRKHHSEETLKFANGILDLEQKVAEKAVRLNNLKKEIEGHEDELKVISQEDHNDLAVTLDILSKEIPAMYIHSLIYENIGEEVVPIQEGDTHSDGSPKVKGNVEERCGTVNQIHHLRYFQLGTLSSGNMFHLLRKVIAEDETYLSLLWDRNNYLEQAHGSPVHIVGGLGSLRPSSVSCPPMILDKSDMSNDMRNPQQQSLATDGGLEEKWINIQSVCISPASSTNHIGPIYWETNTRLKKNEKGESWSWLRPQRVLEIWLKPRSESDHRGMTSCWAIAVNFNDIRRNKVITVVLADKKPVQTRTIKNVYSKSDTTVLRYGIVFDRKIGRIGFIDIENEYVFHKFDVELKPTVDPMFSVYTPSDHSNVDTDLVSGKDIKMTKRKKALIYEALSKPLKLTNGVEKEPGYMI